ncbi:MAG: DUF4926 domain-containing protein [Microcystis novacekii Mn_MB_F_20050700_S1]|uniref:DUF4926 domain-containing protein n=1 Tax=Microcystis novacekii Mn_MB_F_20050700_S1D TaxID=2486266 RepID=A0A552IKZ4_9CHRO|nr:MAG: DUF4926 domain-containing protein [Microcystis novacekii Mn_MB_F_20050700_S1D]TRU90438.1 MAG: DUF4926 domain-containing protein [Microcystis novacekii Mn_MB_F_20050700_S1]
MIKELDVITLTHDIQEHGLKKGTQGAIVHCYNDQQAYEVEFVNDEGETLAILTLGKADIQLEQELVISEVLEIINTLPPNLLREVRDFARVLQHRN